MENKKPKRRKIEINFERYLWNKHQQLNDRLKNKISYLSKVLSFFKDILKVEKDHYKNIKALINEEISSCKEEKNLEELITCIKASILKHSELGNKMYNEIIKNIQDLIDKMVKEKTIYIDYINSLHFYNDCKKKMENLKIIYHQNALIAEKSTLYLKEILIKKLLNNDPLIYKQIDLSEIESKNRLATMAKDCSIYISSLDNVNHLRSKINQKQSKLLKVYEKLEKEDKILYSKILEFIDLYQKGIIDESYQMLQKKFDMDKDIIRLIKDLRSRDKPEKEIPYVHYPTEIDFNKCNDAKDYKVCNEVIRTIKKYHNSVFTNYDEKLEYNKNKMRELLFKFFDMNKVKDNDDKKQLLEYVQDERIHEICLIVLLKIRTSNRFCQEKYLIELLSEILNIILSIAQKYNNWDFAKKIIILSQTFYYLDESKKKVYIEDKIKNHPWISSMKFWKDFIIVNLMKEFKKLEDMNPDLKLEISKNNNITENLKQKIGEVMFSQLLISAGYMIEYNIEKKYIIKIINDISNKFNYMRKENLESIYNIIYNSKEELEQVQKEIENDPELKESCLNEELINPKNDYDNDNDRDEDEDEDEIEDY